jgi:hypothetical protein
MTKAQRKVAKSYGQPHKPKGGPRVHLKLPEERPNFGPDDASQSGDGTDEEGLESGSDDPLTGRKVTEDENDEGVVHSKGWVKKWQRDEDGMDQAKYSCIGLLIIIQHSRFRH